MNKKIISVFVVLVFIVNLFIIVPVTAEDVISQGSGYTGVPFTNGFVAFCLDRSKPGASNGDAFTPVDTSDAASNLDNKEISHVLKALITQCFNDLFTYDDAKGYVVKDPSYLQHIIWNLTDGQWINTEKTNILAKAKAYNGPEIPDSGYNITLENGDVITFDFFVFKTQKDNQQDFFAYKLTTGNVPDILPTTTPTVEPTVTPTVEPTAMPTVEPTATPTVEPTVTPTPPTEDNTNPETGENIMIYIGFVISFIIMGAVVFKRKRPYGLIFL